MTNRTEDVPIYRANTDIDDNDHIHHGFPDASSRRTSRCRWSSDNSTSGQTRRGHPRSNQNLKEEFSLQSLCVITFGLILFLIRFFLLKWLTASAVLFSEEHGASTTGGTDTDVLNRPLLQP
ncbi:hypothetical protein LSAT2_024106 [Lamellibrachia satsuma]|nr:hypothetical protein LSAT2_024106 [Lamellibrachia satsuma]